MEPHHHRASMVHVNLSLDAERITAALLALETIAAADDDSGSDHPGGDTSPQATPSPAGPSPVASSSGG